MQNKKDPNIGLILFNIHRNTDVVGSISPNKNSFKLNSNLGLKIKNINLQRYIFLHNYSFKKILKVDKKKLFNNKKINSLKNNNKIKSSWVSVIPKDYNNLWKKFSNKFYLCINKDLDYMKKRYLKNPFIKYSFLKIENLNKKMIGFSVVRFQTQKNIIFARIIEFISTNNNEINVWNEILYRNSQYGASLSDFFVVGNNQNLNLKKIGFNKMTKNNIYYNIPNLLSPLNYRHWTNNFHLGGLMINKNDQKNLENIWFTKGDGDRDHPTNYDIKSN